LQVPPRKRQSFEGEAGDVFIEPRKVTVEAMDEQIRKLSNMSGGARKGYHALRGGGGANGESKRGRANGKS